MRWLVDEAYPDVPVVRLVLYNLNAHRMAPLYEAFPPAEARRIVKRLEFHHTPKHSSWLNMAEIEFSVLARACLKGRNPDEDSLRNNINAYEAERNRAGTTKNWRSGLTVGAAVFLRRPLYRELSKGAPVCAPLFLFILQYAYRGGSHFLYSCVVCSCRTLLYPSLLISSVLIVSGETPNSSATYSWFSCE